MEINTENIPFSFRNSELFNNLDNSDGMITILILKLADEVFEKILYPGVRKYPRT